MTQTLSRTYRAVIAQNWVGKSGFAPKRAITRPKGRGYMAHFVAHPQPAEPVYRAVMAQYGAVTP